MSGFSKTIHVTSVETTRRIGQLKVYPASRLEAIGKVSQSIDRNEPCIFAFCNAHTVNIASTSQEFVSAVEKATLFNDGVGLDVASRILYGQRFPENLNGTDLTPQLLENLPADTKIFLLGSAPGVASLAQRTLAIRYPELSFVGAEDGFFALDAEPKLAQRIADARAQLVLVGMGHPKQELWAARNVDAIDAVVLCVGAFLDFTAGEVRRAPPLVRKLRLEWVYRLVQEPRRLMRRYLIGNAAFLFRILYQRIGTRKP